MSEQDKKYDLKLAAMILLIANDNKINRTSLNKNLFFADVAALIRSKTNTISNADYLKLDFGPVPEQIDETRNWLVSSGLLEESSELNGRYLQHSYLSNLTEEEVCRLSRTFADDETEIIMKTAKAFKSSPANYLSQKSHEFEPWKSAQWYQVMEMTKAIDDSDLKKWLLDKNIINN